jgi:hypothetical protein
VRNRTALWGRSHERALYSLRSAMNRLTDIAARRPRLAWALTVIVAIVVAGCKNGAGSGY